MTDERRNGLRRAEDRVLAGRLDAKRQAESDRLALRERRRQTRSARMLEYWAAKREAAQPKPTGVDMTLLRKPTGRSEVNRVFRQVA